MRSHSEYIPLTQDQIALAQHTDIVEYLRERGEKVQKEGNHFLHGLYVAIFSKK